MGTMKNESRFVPITVGEAVGLVYGDEPPTAGAETVILLAGQLRAPLRGMLYEVADALLAVQESELPGGTPVGLIDRLAILKAVTGMLQACLPEGGAHDSGRLDPELMTVVGELAAALIAVQEASLPSRLRSVDQAMAVVRLLVQHIREDLQEAQPA
jgi:hypothetical protein